MAEKDAKTKSTDTPASTVKAKPAQTKTTAKTAAEDKPTAVKQTATKTATTQKPSSKSANEKVAQKPAPKTAKAEKPAQKAATPKPTENTASKVQKPAEKPAEKELPKAEKPVQNSKAKTEQTKESDSRTAKKADSTPVSSKKEIKEEPRKDKAKLVDKVDDKPTEADKPKKAEKKFFEKKEKSDIKEDKPSKLKIKKKPLAIIIGAVAVVVLIAILVGIIVGVKSCNSSDEGILGFELFEYRSTQEVGFASKVTGTVSRVKPVEETTNGGLPAYPKYGNSLNSVLGSSQDKIDARTALINESSYLTATGTWNGGGGQYTWMDKDGYLYRGTTAAPVPTLDSQNKHRQLYKHSASVGLYYGDVADDEPAVVKEVTMRPRGYLSGYGVTGLYAPAGEVIKIQMSEADMEATGGIVIHIGQALFNGKANNIWTEKNQMQRFPVILNTMSVTKSTATLENGVYTAYVGSFVGGPIYIRNEDVKFTATISGGVRYSHFILGHTTPEEFEENAKSSAPYFDLEVWSYGVLHSGPKRYAQNYTYDDIFKAAVLWEKVSLVSTTNSLQGIVFIYDPFVAAGAAVAFPGQGSVNCPADWMSGSLNYDGLVKSGSWGNFHEYHHNFQGYGVGDGGEVTNNGMNLVSYALFTKISSSRGIGNFGAAGLGGWNNYTSATWALEEVLKIAREGESPSNGNKGLALYATLLHNFGPDSYIKAKVQQQKNGYGESYAGYLRAWQDITHNDMSYYFNSILGAGLTNTWAVEGYPMFVPVSSVYQTGRSYMYDGEKKYITTMQPYVIPYGQDFTIDLTTYDNSGGMYRGGSIKLPEGFSYTIKDIKQPEHGSITHVGNKLYKFTPDDKYLRSGKIIVTLEITKNDGAFKVDDVDLVLEFEQTHETTKNVLERTTYTFEADKMYTDAVAAYERGYVNYTSKEIKNHSNPVQNCNTDIWFYPADEEHKDSPYAVKANTIEELRGKLYFQNEGTYRIYLRGRSNCALYYSLDGGKSYALGATIKDCPANSHLFRPNDENTYFDVTVDADSWLYFKAILIVQTSPMVSYIGLGMSQWTAPMFTIQEVRDETGNVIVKKYFNHLGIEVSEEVANKAQPIAPVVTSSSQPYVNAYRTTYTSVSTEFESDYFYTREYKFDYQDYIYAGFDQTVIANNYVAPPTSWGWGNFPLSNLTDGNKNTFIHTRDGVSANNPLQLVMDLGEVKTANRMTIYSQYRPNGDWKVAKAFTLEGSIDGNEFFMIGDFTNVPRKDSSAVVDFEETKFRYYRLVITESYNGHIIIGEIEFVNALEFIGGKQHSPYEEMFKYRGSWTQSKQLATFGHSYVGKNNSSLEFEFEGSRMLILSPQALGKDFEVYVDGKRMPSVEKSPLSQTYFTVYVDGNRRSAVNVKGDKSDIVAAYISQELTQGKHKVVIKCVGDAAIDSIVLFP